MAKQNGDWLYYPVGIGGYSEMWKMGFYTWDLHQGEAAAKHELAQQLWNQNIREEFTVARAFIPMDE
jgi:hypothetical protein